jgi:acylglycerol lipase
VVARVTAALQHLTASDRTRLPYRLFRAPRAIERGSVVYLHGIQSHGGWYVDTAAELARRGFTVFLPDRRGSGASAGPRGDFGTRRRLVEDVRQMLDLARRAAPERPVVLVGGCWGARPAVSAALLEQSELAGLALICPAMKPRVDLRPADKVRVLVGRAVRPRLPVRVPLTPEMFTDNPEYLEFIRTDPLSLRQVTARFFFEMFLWDRELARQRGLTLPLLLMQSGRDPIVDVEAVRRWFDRLQSERTETIVYPDFGHILDFEEERGRYWNDLTGWLERVCASHRSAPAELRSLAP